MKKGITAIAIVGVILFGAVVFRDEVNITVLETEQDVHPSEDVVNQFGQLTINGFQWLSEDVRWLDENRVLFSGRRSTEESLHYVFDSSTLEIDIIESTIESESTLDSLVETDAKLFISGNEDKIGYLDETSNSFVAYDVSSDRKATMQYKKGVFEDVAVDQPMFSADGGFITFEEKSVNYHERKFSILGGDSGRFYGKDIKGMTPVFSPDSKTVGFIYTGQTEGPNNDAKIGLFILKYKKIIYLDTLLEGVELYPNLAWSNDSEYLYAVTKKEHTVYQVNRHDVQNGGRDGIVIDLEFDAGQIREMKWHNGQLYIVFDNKQLCVLDTDSGRYNLLGTLLKHPDGQYLQEIATGELLVILSGKVMAINGESNRIVGTYDGELVDINMSTGDERLLMLYREAEEMKLRISDI